MIGKNKEIIIKLSIQFTLFCLLTIVFFNFGKTIVINADGVANILEAISILKGNILLHGWTLPPDTFYTLDTQVDTLFLWLGINPIYVYHLTPAVIYSSLLLVLYNINKLLSGSNVTALTSLALFVSINSPLYKSLVLFSPIHIMTIIFVLLVYYFYYQSSIKTRIILGSFFLYLAVLGDPYSMFIGTLPIVMYSFFNIYRENVTHEIIRNRNLELIFYSVMATLLAKLSVYAIRVFGGYHAASNQFRFIALDKFSHNIYLLALSLLDITQSNFFGLNIFSLRTIVYILHMLTIIFFIYALVRYKFGKNPIADVCLISGVTTSLCFVLSTQPADVWSSRYLLDIPIFISVIFASSEIIYKNKKVSPLLITFALIFTIYFFVDILKEKPASLDVYNNVIRTLEKNNLTYGLAGYWNAAPFTLLSGNHIKVRQVVNSNGKIVPYMWLSNSSWYSTSSHPQFFILKRSGKSGLTVDSVIKNFGPYKKLKIIGPYKIMIYKN